MNYVYKYGLLTP